MKKLQDLKKGELFSNSWGEYERGDYQSNSPACGILCKSLETGKVHCFLGFQIVKILPDNNSYFNSFLNDLL